MSLTTTKTVQVEGLRLAYRELGEGPQIGIERLGLAVHDLGGPVGLHWALGRPGRRTKLALLNTLVYPEFSEAVKEFVRACASPELREKLTSPPGLEAIMRDGLADPGRLTAEVLAAVQAPFGTAEARRALADAGIGLSRRGFAQIARVKTDLPRADVTVLPHCGHFLQEEAPAEVGELLARFFAP